MRKCHRLKKDYRIALLRNWTTLNYSCRRMGMRRLMLRYSIPSTISKCKLLCQNFLSTSQSSRDMSQKLIWGLKGATEHFPKQVGGGILSMLFLAPNPINFCKVTPKMFELSSILPVLKSQN